MVSRLIIAAAGSGKTTYLVNKTLEHSSENVLITTFTRENEQAIRKKFFDRIGYIPPNVTIQTWFSFLLEHGVKPYQGCVVDGKINGLVLVNGQSGFRYRRNGKSVYYSEKKHFERYYFTEDRRVYSDKLAKLVVRCVEKSGDAVIDRLRKIYPNIYIDEVQDLCGYDLEIIRLFLSGGVNLLMVGDPRQVTYHTHFDTKYSRYSDGRIADFVRSECPRGTCVVDEDTLRYSYRNIPEICALSAKLYPEYKPCKSRQEGRSGHDGIFRVRIDEVSSYLHEYRPTQLRLNKACSVDEEYPVLNFGEAKGSEFDHVLIYPTKEMRKWFHNQNVKLKPRTRAQLYVAITRARFSVAVVVD